MHVALLPTVLACLWLLGCHLGLLGAFKAMHYNVIIITNADDSTAAACLKAFINL